MVAKDPTGIAWRQVKAYWSFLCAGYVEDVEQEIAVALLEAHPSDHGLKAFNLALNRRLYSLARAVGFRKRHMNEGANAQGHWWERRTISIGEAGLEEKR